MLDIIIPTYNDPKGLEKTLSSIDFRDDINVTVVNDCSTIDYSAVYNKYPFSVRFISLQKNSGPGAARQFGINNTSNPYIMCIDSGDYIASKYAFDEILDTIQSYPDYFIYSWPWIVQNKNTLREASSEVLHGKVFKREYLEYYKITFGNSPSYTNEDIAFVHNCRAIINYLNKYGTEKKELRRELPFYIYTYNENSLTHKNNNEFEYKTQIKGLTENMLHTAQNCVMNHIDEDIIIGELSLTFARIYYDFLNILINYPDYAQFSWDLIYKFYWSGCEQYGEKFIVSAQNNLSVFLPLIKKLKLPRNLRINIRRFILDVRNNKNITDNYLTFS